jgi:Dyp-type peroxidase family
MAFSVIDNFIYRRIEMFFSNKCKKTYSVINLDDPLAWTKANSDELLMLQCLQGNILKGHGRHFTANIFFSFGLHNEQESRRVLRELANYHLTSAHKQLLDVKHFKETGESGGKFCHLALTAKGYRALGLDHLAPQDRDFQLGMQSADSIYSLCDPELEHWEPAFQGDIHGILLVANGSEDETTQNQDELTELLQNVGCNIIHVQRGKAIFNDADEGIEHFGYVDGRSQPLMLVEDIEAEAETSGSSRWNPAFPLKTALVKDPGVYDDVSYGSFFIFRKLEQFVRGFKNREVEIAEILSLEGEKSELAGAMIVGRFEDGTPVTMSDEARKLKPPNDFNYEGDPGSRCPFHAHIRKVNPRGSSGTEERSHIMARRGIPFEDKPRSADFEEFPENGVGLLFMAYNNNIDQQFKFVQQNWANNTNFPVEPSGTHGIDPVIGQGVNEPHDQKMPKEWDNPAKGTNDNCPFASFVKMRGGEYFFSPSLTFLKNL